MTTRADLVTRLRTKLKDSGATAHWTDDELEQAVRDGNNALYPRIYVPATDVSLTTLSSTIEYTLPADIPLNAGFNALRQVLVRSSSPTTTRSEYVRKWRVDEGRGVLLLQWAESAGRVLELVYMKRLRDLVADNTVFEGSAAAEQAVLEWASSEAFSIDRRRAVRRPERLQGLQGLTTYELSSFENLMDRLAMQPPVLVK